MIDKKKIVTLTTVVNFDFIKRRQQFFLKTLILVIDGTNGLCGLDSINFMYKNLKIKNTNGL